MRNKRYTIIDKRKNPLLLPLKIPCFWHSIILHLLEFHFSMYHFLFSPVVRIMIDEMNPLLLGSLIFLVLGIVPTIVILALYKGKKISRVAAEYTFVKLIIGLELAFLYLWCQQFACGWCGFVFTWCRFDFWVDLVLSLDEPSIGTPQEVGMI